MKKYIVNLQNEAEIIERPFTTNATEAQLVQLIKAAQGTGDYDFKFHSIEKVEDTNDSENLTCDVLDFANVPLDVVQNIFVVGIQKGDKVTLTIAKTGRNPKGTKVIGEITLLTNHGGAFVRLTHYIQPNGSIAAYTIAKNMQVLLKDVELYNGQDLFDIPVITENEPAQTVEPVQPAESNELHLIDLNSIKSILCQIFKIDRADLVLTTSIQRNNFEPIVEKTVIKADINGVYVNFTFVCVGTDSYLLEEFDSTAKKGIVNKLCAAFNNVVNDKLNVLIKKLPPFEVANVETVEVAADPFFEVAPKAKKAKKQMIKVEVTRPVEATIEVIGAKKATKDVEKVGKKVKQIKAVTEQPVKKATEKPAESVMTNDEIIKALNNGETVVFKKNGEQGTLKDVIDHEKGKIYVIKVGKREGKYFEQLLKNYWNTVNN